MSDSRNAQRLALAIDCLHRGNLPGADILCRNILDTEPDNGDAWNVLGAVAVRVTQLDRAIEYFDKAAALGSAEAPGNAEKARRVLAAKRVVAPTVRYLLIKAWGHGFWSDVSHVLGGLLLAEITDRIPVVHWGRTSLFGDGTDRDAFTLYFEPVSAISAGDLTRLDQPSFFPAMWHKENLLHEDDAKFRSDRPRPGAVDFLGRTETVAVAEFYISVATIAPWIPSSHALARVSVADLYRYAIQKHLRPVPSILSDAESFHRTQLAGSDFASAHLRGSDKFGEVQNFSAAVDRAFKHLERVDASTPIFVMTDDERIVQRSRAQYGSRAVMTDCQRTSSDHGIHFMQSADRHKLGIEIMRDVYIALRATRFVGIGTSNPSAMISLMKQWPPGRCELVGEPGLLYRSGYIYLPRAAAGLGAPDR